MDDPIPSKRSCLSTEVEPNVSWTQDEWTELLTNECSIKKERAHQIASNLAEQDFNTGRFSSFISEWQNNAKGCIEILVRVGFKDLEIVSFVALLRRHSEKATKQKQTTIVEIANRKRPMCNELVWAVCKGIGVVKTSDRILLTSASIYAYLEKAFRKKLIYRDGTNFIKANIWRKFSIAISLKDQNVGNEIMVIDQKQTESEYELWTNHLHIRMWKECNWSKSVYLIDENALENAHVHFFLRLIAPQLRPIAIVLTFFRNSTLSSAAARFLNKMHDSIDLVHLRKKQLSLEPISAVLNKCNKLVIYSLDRMDEDQKRQFCDSLIQWIKARNGGQPKMCAIYALSAHETVQMLDAINKDFVSTTHKQPFAIRIGDTEALAEFTVRNVRTQEQLQLRRIGERRYMLMRQLAITELDNYYNQRKLEWEFDNLDKMFSIEITSVQSMQSDDSDSSESSDDSEY